MASWIPIRNVAARPLLCKNLRFGFSPTVLNAQTVLFTASALSASSSAPRRKLILYSKPGCCLCDGLKEKLDAAFSLSGPHSIHDVQLQIRDITSNPEWEKLYQYEIPVLARVREDGTEVCN
ncbi:uncharacterized protein LOC142533460 isoform X2 [Primulina tabacum]|uniref:uncharacterized protein LOC142533460 isoform X2 n=1 Tax=Primulina tabacum TaxID=48773 RepID=UPI003F597E7B